jgi:CheY-like chemotaxis protein
MNLLKITADTVESGAEAIEAVKNKDYDLVFMDHMMPEMDGVEATAIIRGMGGKYKTLPIVALTANAVAGAKEMFLENGFDDFISKPIDSRELIAFLETRLPESKVIKVDLGEGGDAPAKEKTNFRRGLDSVEELNTEIGLARVSGAEDLYRGSLELFNERLPSECGKMSAALGENDLNSFAITVHSMKSALSTVGAMRLADAAQELEMKAKGHMPDYCSEHYPVFEEKLLALYEQLSRLLKREYHAATNAVKKRGGTAYLRLQSEKAVSAAEEFDSDMGFELLMGLTEFDYGDETNALLESVKAAFLEFDCGQAAKKLRRIIAEIED